jgi:hypothetical protein
LILSCLSTHYVSELPPGIPRRKASAYVGDISAKWNAMTQEEQEDVTADALEELKDHRDKKTTGRHNNFRSAFQDARATLCSVECDVCHSIHISSSAN